MKKTIEHYRWIGVALLLGSTGTSQAQSWHGPYSVGNLRPIHLIMLKSGRYVGWDAGFSPNNEPGETDQAYILEVDDSTLPPQINLTHVPIKRDAFGADSMNMLCTGHILLPDKEGTLFLAGGDKTVEGVVSVGGTQVALFKESGNPYFWKKVGELGDPRWYPNVTMTPSGKILVQAGSRFFDTELPRSYDLITLLQDETIHRTNLLLPSPNETSIYYPHTFTDPLDPNFLVIAGINVQAKRYNLVTDSYENHIINNQGRNWLLYTIYPSTVVVDDLVIKTGQYNLTGLDLDRGGALYADLKVTPEARIWRRTPELSTPEPVDTNIGRRSHITVVLPNKDVMIFGGHRQGYTDTTIDGYWSEDRRRRAPEVLRKDQVTGQWQWHLLPQKAAVSRGYHQTAVLMPSGNVMVASGEPRTDPLTKTIEIFRPAYQDIPNKPTIGMEQYSTLYYGEDFDPQIQLAEGRTVKNVTLITFPSVTHGQSFAHRLITLQKNGDLYRAPEGPHKSPMGWYMLFVEDSEGAISVAKSVRLTERWSRRMPSNLEVVGAAAQGFVTDLYMSDAPPNPVGRRNGKLTLTKRLGARSVSVEFDSEIPATVDPSKGVRVRLEQNLANGGSASGPVLQVLDRTSGKWRTIDEREALPAPSDNDTLTVQTILPNSVDPSLLMPGVKRFRLLWEDVEDKTIFEVDECVLGFWQSDAE